MRVNVFNHAYGEELAEMLSKNMNKKQQKKQVRNVNSPKIYIEGTFLFNWTEEENAIVNWMLEKLYMLRPQSMSDLKTYMEKNNLKLTVFKSWIISIGNFYSNNIFDYLLEVLTSGSVNLDQYMRNVSKQLRGVKTEKEYKEVTELIQKYVYSNRQNTAIIHKTEDSRMFVDFNNILTKVLHSAVWGLAETTHLTLTGIMEELFANSAENKIPFINAFYSIKQKISQKKPLEELSLEELRKLTMEMLSILKKAQNEDLISVEKSGGAF